MGRLDGRVVIVTGAARGQGEQEARLFRDEGAEVLLADVLDDRGEALAKELGARYTHLDVGEEEDWQAAVATAKAAYGHVDGLVRGARRIGIFDRPRAGMVCQGQPCRTVERDREAGDDG